MGVNVGQIYDVLKTGEKILALLGEIKQANTEAVQKAESIRQEAAKEEQVSRGKLESAKSTENECKIAWRLAKAALTAAEAKMAAAAAVGNPVAISSAIKWLMAAQAAEAVASKAYQDAEAHRMQMEARYQLASDAKRRADLMVDKLSETIDRCSRIIFPLSEDTAKRLTKAEGHLSDYQQQAAVSINTAPLASTPVHSSGCRGVSVPPKRPGSKIDINLPASPQGQSGNSISQGDSAAGHSAAFTATGKSSQVKPVSGEILAEQKEKEENNPPEEAKDHFSEELEKYIQWMRYVTQSEVVKPQEIIERMNPPEDIQLGLLENLYRTDPHFHDRVDSYRRKLGEGGKQEEYVRTQSRRNMAGGLGEYIIRDGMAPFAETVETQTRQDLKDGRYTKIDIVLNNLKRPMVFGRGEGMAAMKGGNVAIEVKSGHEDYLKAQEEHILTQVEGHADYELSLVLFSRDIKDMSGESAYRDEIKEAGSKPLGMLPRKDDLNAVVWDFLTLKYGGEGEKA